MSDVRQKNATVAEPQAVQPTGTTPQTQPPSAVVSTDVIVELNPLARALNRTVDQVGAD